MKPKGKILSLLLVICLVAGLMPTTVFAANSGKAIQLGTDALNESINSTNAATVYFGQNDTDQPGAWRVIGYNGNGVASAQGDMTLLAAGNMGLVQFSTNGTNTYADSNLKAAIDALAEKLTEEETAAVNKRTLVSGSYNGENTDCVSGAQVDNAVFWPLSTAEANMVSNDIRALSTEHPDWAMYYWWLRSPGRGYGAAVVIGGGHVDNDGSNVDGEFGVRPAFNLDLNSVLFTSAAAGGKSASGMDSGLTAIGDYTDNEWKLTLLDESRNFAVTETEVSGISGGTVTLNYTGAATGTNEYISVILADENGVQSYGRVAQPTEASGTAEVTIPAGLAVGTYTLYAFSEQYNGDYMTDYASAFETVSLTVTPDKAIMLGTSGISGYDSTNGYDYIYFGNWTAPDEYTTSGPIKWRVLDDQTNTGEAGLFLLTDTLLGSGTYGGVYFGKSSYSKAWQGSDAQTWCATFYGSNFSAGEQGAVIATTKSDEAFTSSTYSIPFAASENILNGDKVFFLSAQEAENSAYGFTDDAARIANYGGSAGVWWLRSPNAYFAGYAGLVNRNGNVHDYDVSYVWAARPAFNLDLTSVLFTSAAVGGKIPAASSGGNQSGEAADAIFEIGDYDGNEWKLTLLDNSRNFAVTEKTASGKPGDTITLNYSGATTGTNEYISVIIADNSGAQYYGRVAQPAEASGTAEVTIPAGLAVGTYTLYAFSEQYNGDYMTDYASAFETVSLTVTPDKAIMLGTSGISGYDSTNGYDYIYFGNWTAPDEYTTSGPIKWRVLDDQTNTGENGLFLLSEELLGTGYYGGVYFQQSYHYDSSSGSYHKGSAPANGDHTDCLIANAWQGSDAQTWCATFYSNNFSTGEQSAVLGTTKSDGAFTSSTYNVPFAASESILNGDKVFFLSAQEAENSAYGFTDDAARIANYGGSAGVWWLRSPDAYYTYFAGAVGYNGYVYYDLVLHDWAARPAFNLDLNSVLFTSAAAGGKSASGMDSGLTAVDDYTGSEWKLTLLDSSRSSFTVDASEAETSVEVGYTSWSIPVDYSGAQTGANEYVSALLCDSNGNVLYYGNIAQNSASGTAALNIPAGLAAGSYSLKVFSEQCNGDYMTDYASALQEISLNVLSKETTPQAVFTAAGDSSGTLSNVDASMKYSTDGGASWTDITGTTAEITGVTADKDIQVVKKGDGTATVDSDAQIIDVTQAAIPVGIGKTDCTTAAQNDGTITGVDSTMEYRLSSASEWTSISGNTVSGLANGTYEVRVKANGTVLASEVATVIIGAHTCAAQGDWQHDANEHWKLCACGAEVDRAAHTGGTATCTEKAVCDVCGSSYGAINPDNHTGEIVWTKTATAHSSKYSCCDAVVVAEEAHEWENGVCAECGYECQHDGGTATCTEKAVCDICGEEYGELNASNHTNLVKTEAKAATHMTEGNIEYWYCDGCDKYFSDEAGTKEIALKDTVIPKLTEHTADGTGWHSDETNHWNTCECGEKLNEAAHTFEWVTDKEATATEAGSKHEECTVCGYAKAAVEIPATGETTSPETGDNSNIALWIAVMLAAGTALTGTVLYSRKRKYSR